MKKILLFAASVLFALYSCKKETATKQAGILQTLPTPTFSANGIMREPIGVDLSGFPLLDLCSYEIWTTISGTVVFDIASDGDLKPLGVYNLVFQDRKATIYRGEYIAAIEPFRSVAGVSNTYKLIFNPRGDSINKVLFALVQVNAKEKGKYTILIDSGAVECQ